MTEVEKLEIRVRNHKTWLANCRKAIEHDPDDARLYKTEDDLKGMINVAENELRKHLGREGEDYDRD